jgi:hypothetical protein
MISGFARQTEATVRPGTTGGFIAPQSNAIGTNSRQTLFRAKRRISISGPRFPSEKIKKILMQAGTQHFDFEQMNCLVVECESASLTTCRLNKPKISTNNQMV